VSTSADLRPKRLVSERTEGMALVLFTACSWGLTLPQSKFLLTMLPPFSMRASCGVIGFSFAFLVAAVRGERLWPPRSQWPRLILFAMLNYGLFIVLTTQSLVWLKASEAVVITYTLPVWTSLLAWPMLGERPTLQKILALILALGGVALLVGADTAEATWQKLPAAGMSLRRPSCSGSVPFWPRKSRCACRLPPASHGRQCWPWCSSWRWPASSIRIGGMSPPAAGSRSLISRRFR
jgi:uncharacterized membrane protein